MGLFVSALFDRLSIFTKKDVRVCMVGLDGAGKTTILYKLKLGEVAVTIPTIGFNVETVQYRNINFTVWDVGGQQVLRKLWVHYYPNTAAVIYVVDSSDRDKERIDTAKEELDYMLKRDELRNSIFLIMANKQDFAHAMSTAEVADKLELTHIRSHKWKIQGTSAINGDGIYDGLDWLSHELSSM